ncbi:MAG: helix-hairpin-helix domain-containing protein [Ferruginibacter sp.]
MTNYEIADSFSLLSQLMDIHGENSFKSKSYSAAAFTIEKLPLELSEMEEKNIASIKGIGASTSQKISELLQTGHLKTLDDLFFSTPPGVVDMLKIKGIGPKKIHTIWKEMEIESIGELLYACVENRLKLYKGFGEKTQQNVTDKINFYLKNMGTHLYVSAEKIAAEIELFLKELFGEKKVLTTGHFKRQIETVNELEFVIEADKNYVENCFKKLEDFSPVEQTEDSLTFKTSAGINIKLHPVTKETFLSKIIETSSPESFVNELKALGIDFKNHEDEEGLFRAAGLAFIPPALRDYTGIIALSKEGRLPDFIKEGDIKGIIHCHSNWSDGSNTIEEMAKAARQRGMEYLVISDHSKSAFYAQGLNEEKIKAQHLYIDELNESLKPFKIFKSIESDILNDGNLDYADSVLSGFDLVIASVHSNLKMTQEKAMMRLIKAIENPFTTILGHMTGRLLLSREGYPIDHKLIIDACAANDVVIELNAHPNRLDMDWRHIAYALRKNVLISIDPDSHFTEGLDDIKYGILVAQKALLPKEKNLSSFSLQDFEKFLSVRKLSKNI